MTHFCPAYPKPKKTKTSRLLMFFSAQRSWLDGLYERSYSMLMGEVHFPGLDLYMLNEPALVKRVLVEQPDDFAKNELLGKALRPLLGDSILTTNGKQWMRQRIMMEPAFAQARVNVAFPVMQAATQSMLARLDALPDGTVHDVELEMTHVTSDIIFRSIFSIPMDGAVAHRVFASFAKFQALAPKLMVPSIYGVRWLVLPWDVWRSRKAAAEIRDMLVALVKPRFEAYQAGTGSDKSDILDAFLNARDPDSHAPFEFDELIDQVAVLFLAGHETTASALTWALHLIAESPDIQEKMYAEVMQLMPYRFTNSTDMKKLDMVRNVFRESLRLFPPVGFIARQSGQACTMRDKNLKKGASVIISPWLIHRHRDYWQQPDAFNPDRYNDDLSRESLQKAYLPFGMGPRVCMGAAFAQQEATLILSSLVRHYRLQSLPGHVPRPVGRLTIRPANGVRLTLHKRPPRQSVGEAL